MLKHFSGADCSNDSSTHFTDVDLAADGSENVFVHRADVVGADGRPVLAKGMSVFFLLPGMTVVCRHRLQGAQHKVSSALITWVRTRNSAPCKPSTTPFVASDKVSEKLRNLWRGKIISGLLLCCNSKFRWALRGHVLLHVCGVIFCNQMWLLWG